MTRFDRRSVPTRWLLPFLFVVASTACAGNDSDVDSSVLDREAFVQTYVDLRAGAVTTGDTLTDSLRTAILERRGVTEAELMEFAEVRGADLAYMRDVWMEVEARLRNRHIPAPPTDEP